MKKTKLWRSLETLADGATLAEWTLELGGEFKLVRPFLFETRNESRSYPCPKASRCECRQHRIEQFENGRRIAVCECGECPPMELEAADLRLYELDKARLANAVARACGWTVATDGWELPVWRLGRWDELRGNLFWCASNGLERTRKIADSLLTSEPSPFILLLPTAMNLSSRLDRALKREGCLALALDEYLTIENDGKFRLVKSLETARQEFLERSAKRDTVKVFRGIHDRFDEFGAEHRELRRAKARLETMLAEGLFAFTKQVDARAFKVICTILAQGDVAKASRELNMSDTALRDEIKSWKGRGKVYETLADLVRWRKVVGRSQEIPLNDSILLEKTKNVDHPALMSDVLDELLSMTEGNWADKAEDLAERLRPHVPR